MRKGCRNTQIMGAHMLALAEAWGAGALVGGAGGALIGGGMAAGSGFLSNTAYLGLSNGSVLGGGTLLGGALGSGIGAAYDHTADYTLRGGIAGFLTAGASIVATNGYQWGQQFTSSSGWSITGQAMGKTLPAPVQDAKPTIQFLPQIIQGEQ